ncbi:MAG: sigma-70 family RNA polymerase sigma factor [Flammeovirgaceae bacterium]|nr:sigma-70 family RNA polymerase sigma factor [Flammeovirgaceae bacterium]
MHKPKQDLEFELAIIEQAKKKPEAFGLLYEKYYKEIFYYINRRIDDVNTTSDLSSQVFYKAMVNIKSYKFKGFPFSSWLYRIATNQVNEYYRKSKNQRVINLEDQIIFRLFGELEEQPEKEEDKTGLLVSLLEELEEHEVQLLELRFFEEKPFKEVAFILNITENNAKVRTYRILDKLKKIAKRKLPPEESDFLAHFPILAIFIVELIRQIPATI